jgi:hypothetical protein
MRAFVFISIYLHEFRQKQDVGLDMALAREADCQAHSYASPDIIKGINAIINKTTPVFD